MGEAATLFTVSMAVIAMLGNAWTAREKRLERQAELANDKEKQQLKSEVENCAEDRKEALDRIVQLESQVASMRLQLDRYLLQPTITSVPLNEGAK